MTVLWLYKCNTIKPSSPYMHAYVRLASLATKPRSRITNL